MNENNPSAAPEPSPQPPIHRSSAVPPLPQSAEPFPENAGIGTVLETLLKRPMNILEAIERPGGGRVVVALALAALFAFALYGVVVGMFSGGDQLFAAPLKISLGALASVLICLPSFFIFACLSGAEVTLRSICGTLAAMAALAALLLIGFAPVAWVFSQSSNSIPFVGALHLIFWFIAVGFGLRMLTLLMMRLRVAQRFHLHVWALIFVLVTLQMTTALRPIIGTSTDLLPREKKFFLVHWGDNLAGN